MDFWPLRFLKNIEEPVNIYQVNIGFQGVRLDNSASEAYCRCLPLKPSEGPVT
jgi:hypothetical protein